MVNRIKRRSRHFKRRAGYTMIETIASVTILGLLMIVIARTLMMKVDDQSQVDAQYSLLAADAFLADIYTDFHNCVSYEVDETPGGQNMIMFKRSDGTINIYSFDSNEGACYKNGAYQFDAQSFGAEGVINNVIITLKLTAERVLEMNIYK